MLNKFRKQKGVIAIFTVILVLIILIIILAGLEFLTSYQQRIYRNSVLSLQAYYAAESGIESALYDLQDWQIPSSDNVGIENIVDACKATINISEIVGGARTVTSEGNCSGIIRKIRVVYKITADSVKFHYGAQADDGGIDLGNNAKIYGNVYSNGNVENRNAGAWGYIYGSIIAAEDSKIKNLKIGETVKARIIDLYKGTIQEEPGSYKGDAYTYDCDNSMIDTSVSGTITYVNSSTNCSASGGVVQKEPVPAPPYDRKELPISDPQINEWKTDAAVYDETDFANGCMTIDEINHNAIIDGCEDEDYPFYLGPVKIGTESSPLNLIIKNGNFVRITGTLHVTGNIIFENNSTVQLSTFYGDMSGIIMADGTISADATTFLGGSGEAKSYILVLSTYPYSDTIHAIDIKNNTIGAIFYANHGTLHISNQVIGRELTGYKIIMDNTAKIIYESGLADALFTSGPGGGWKVVSWEEVQ